MGEYSIELLKQLYKEYEETPSSLSNSNLRKYNKGHVFDEDKSVKWNNEEVDRRNKQYDDAFKQIREDKAALLIRFNIACTEYIKQEVGCNDNTAQRIRYYVYDRYHSFMSEYFDALEEIVDLAAAIRKDN